MERRPGPIEKIRKARLDSPRPPRTSHRRRTDTQQDWDHPGGTIDVCFHVVFPRLWSLILPTSSNRPISIRPFVNANDPRTVVAGYRMATMGGLDCIAMAVEHLERSERSDSEGEGPPPPRRERRSEQESPVAAVPVSLAPLAPEPRFFYGAPKPTPTAGTILLLRSRRSCTSLGSSPPIPTLVLLSSKPASAARRQPQEEEERASGTTCKVRTTPGTSRSSVG